MPQTIPRQQTFAILWAFLVRDFHTQISYRAAFALSFVGLFFRAFIFFFISRFIGDVAALGLTSAGYQGDYFAFVLIGLAFNLYVGLGLTAFAEALREAQTTGTLEAMMMTPTPVSLMVVGSAGWSYAFTTLRVVVYLGLGVLLGMDLGGANWGLAAVALLLALIAFASIGIIAASVIMVIKRGDPITALVANVSALVGGVYYPIEVLPVAPNGGSIRAPHPRPAPHAPHLAQRRGLGRGASGFLRPHRLRPRPLPALPPHLPLRRQQSPPRWFAGPVLVHCLPT
ncbi:MAG: ABC transporter permease [Chloroflexi bacterium]|nr:ABC transporter permease [Chloroflexota bacterium]